MIYLFASVPWYDKITLNILVNMQSLVTMPSRCKRTIHVNNNCHAQVEVMTSAFLRTPVSAVLTNTAKAEFLKISPLSDLKLCVKAGGQNTQKNIMFSKILHPSVDEESCLSSFYIFTIIPRYYC